MFYSFLLNRNETYEEYIRKHISGINMMYCKVFRKCITLLIMNPIEHLIGVRVHKHFIRL